MGKKQKVKATTKTKVKKAAVKKVIVKKAGSKKVVVKPGIKKPAVKKVAVKNVKTKPVALKKVAKAVAKKAVVKKAAKPVKKVAIQKPKPKAVAKPVQPVKATKPVSPVKVTKPVSSVKATKPTAPVAAINTAPDKKPVKKIIVPAKKREIHPNQYTIEYPIHASASLLFEIISSPSGLSEWFADNVNIRDGNFTFFWDGSQQTAKMVAYKEEKMVRFRWTDKPDYTFFEFKIETDELTNDTSLIITDFAEDGDKESAKLLWDNQINGLKHAIGS